MTPQTLHARFRQFLLHLHQLETEAASGRCDDALNLNALQTQTARCVNLFNELQAPLPAAERTRLERQLRRAWGKLQELVAPPLRAVA